MKAPSPICQPQPALRLAGARKKPERHARTEGVTKFKHRPYYYARLYPAGAKRAVYRSTGRMDVASAEQTLTHLRANLSRQRKPAGRHAAQQLELIR